MADESTINVTDAAPDAEPAEEVNVLAVPELMEGCHHMYHDTIRGREVILPALPESVPHVRFDEQGIAWNVPEEAALAAVNIPGYALYSVAPITVQEPVVPRDDEEQQDENASGEGEQGEGEQGDETPNADATVFEEQTQGVTPGTEAPAAPTPAKAKTTKAATGK